MARFPGSDVELRVSLDVSAVPAAPAGAGRYTLELARALAARDTPDLVALSRRTDAARWEGVLGPRGTVRAVAPAPRPLRLAWEQVTLPGLLRRAGVQVHHGPHYTMPERARVPVVVTVHDCTFFDHPEWHERTKVVLFRRAIRVAASRAAAVVCVSETTARHLREVCTVAAPVVVAPHGVDHARFSPDPPAGSTDEGTLRRLGLEPGRRYLLFVGTLEPRKDVASLVTAFASIAGSHEDLSLVVAGGRGWRDDALQAALSATGRYRQRVVFTGYVPDDAVPVLLRRAAAVAYPSLYEGYGLPALEAMACGAPLVTTSGTAMAEVAGDAAVLVPPGDVDGLAGALSDLLTAGRDDPEVLARRAIGLERAATRTWAASAERHVDAYRIAAGGG